MRVAMMVWNDFLNDARVLKEAETLCCAGHDVTVFALHFPGRTRQTEILASGVKVSRIAPNPFRLPMAGKPSAISPAQGRFRSMGRIAARAWAHVGFLYRMVRMQPDVIHAHDVNTLPTAYLASRFARTRLVYDAHEISTDREGYAAFRNVVGSVEKRLMPRADATITTTEARAKFFARAYSIPRPLVLQNRPRFSSPARSSRLREELGLTKPWPVVLYQGGLQPGRGLSNLVQSAAHVPNAYFVFIGSGRQEADLKRLVAHDHLSERVRFIPMVPLDDLPSYTASADIGVQPIENTCLNHLTTDSNKLFEYMMSGLPVVASNLPEIRRIVSRHELGILIEPGNVGQLARALGDLVSNVSKRARFADNARRAASDLSWDQQEHLLVDLYAGLARVKR